ncbi:hypothetical protein [Paenibacillus sacheonensis]|uniref:hypothetical protein n=1 Tax=Paenibacillus sacheonensis TaxID=742054 RepID=UPI00195E09D7|nr:hypothetical protein [Paenibacillus sacheonensis]MBM7568898.1 hypothetical protein [Paenibacillus sacheonensis]
MKRMPFERPAEHYDERIYPIDERICELLGQRKDIARDDPGYPPFAYIAKWAEEHGLFEDYLKAVFGVLGTERHFKPQAVPTGFRKHIPVLRSAEHGGMFYAVNAVRQYANASVVTLHIEWDSIEETLSSADRSRLHFELCVGEGYDCRFESGGSHGGSSSSCYVVSPPLPDDLSGIVFDFRERAGAYRPDSNDAEFVIRLAE